MRSLGRIDSIIKPRPPSALLVTTPGSTHLEDFIVPYTVRYHGTSWTALQLCRIHHKSTIIIGAVHTLSFGLEIPHEQPSLQRTEARDSSTANVLLLLVVCSGSLLVYSLRSTALFSYVRTTNGTTRRRSLQLARLKSDSFVCGMTIHVGDVSHGARTTVLICHYILISHNINPIQSRCHRVDAALHTSLMYAKESDLTSEFEVDNSSQFQT